jgi:FkbM family methyltransferase
MKKAFLKFTEIMARCLPTGLKRAIYNCPPLARLLRAELNKSVPQGISRMTVAAGGLKGAQLELDMHKEKYYWLGTYELELQHAIEHFVKPGMTVFDVGANIGYISLLFSKAVGSDGRVFSVEALPANINRLQANVALNPFAANVTVVHTAIVDATKTVTFLVHDSTSMGKVAGSAGRSGEKYTDEITVDGASLDDLVYKRDLPAPDVIKMDIEGGEVLAMQGMKRLLQEKHPLMMVELHGHEAAQAVYATLQKAGYTFKRMQFGYPGANSDADLDWKAYVVGIPPFTD